MLELGDTPKLQRRKRGSYSIRPLHWELKEQQTKFGLALRASLAPKIVLDKALKSHFQRANCLTGKTNILRKEPVSGSGSVPKQKARMETPHHLQFLCA